MNFLIQILLLLSIFFKSTRGNILSSVSTPLITLVPSNSPTPSLVPTLTITPTKKPVKYIDDGLPWGVAQQLDEHTWTMKIQQDSTMASSVEVFDALNRYRTVHNKSTLNWDQKLADYAQSRADFFSQNKALDSHKGFKDFLDNLDGFNQLGFRSLGENASFGYRLSGVHLIEWIYAGDDPHNKNQLNPSWTHVGIGVVDTSTCLIFASDKI